MAKSFDNLYSEVTSFKNLWLAFRMAAKGKRGQSGVAAFEYRLESNLLILQQALLNKTYRPGAYYSLYIFDPKHRLISAVPFRDRVVHHALCTIIEPLFERTFIDDSYANRLGKGTHAQPSLFPVASFGPAEYKSHPASCYARRGVYNWMETTVWRIR